MPSDRARHVVVYASDHGFGHASRLLALSARLAAEGHHVTLCAGAALPMIRAALPLLRGPIDLAFASLDPGLVARAGALDFDIERSREVLSAWLSSLPRLVADEADRLAALSASLVVADAPAAALLAAERVGIPAVVCSNFTWLDMYAGRFGEAIDAALRRAYAAARAGLRLRLGRMRLDGLSVVHDIDGALARAPLRDRLEVRRELGVEPSELLIGLGLGGSLDASQYETLARSAPRSGVRLLAPSARAEPGALSGALVRFPSITPDPQSYFGACDVVVAKAGYSTLAEAALAGVPLVVFPLAQSPESVRLAEDVETLGLGLALADEVSVRRALESPEELVAEARRAHRGSLADAAPAITSALRSLISADS